MNESPRKQFSGLVPRGRPKVTAEQALINALRFIGGTPSGDAFKRLSELSPSAVPSSPDEQCADYFHKIVSPGVYYSIVDWKDGKTRFPGGIVESASLLDRAAASEIPSFVRGGFVRPNAVSGEGSGWNGCHCDIDVVRHDYLLAESDTLPLPVQAALLHRMIDVGMPIASAVFTGGKSIHALIRINASSGEEFRSESRRIFSRLTHLGFDPSTGNASRMARIPGCIRTLPDGREARQQLLYLA